MVPPHRRALRARLLLLRYVDGISREGSLATPGDRMDKVMAGGTPANPATRVCNEGFYIPSIVRARRAIEIATLVSGSSSCRPVRDWIRSTR
jgi:hypothetical protein